MRTASYRLGILAAFAVSAMPVLIAQTGADKNKTEYFKGEVVPLAEIVAKHGGKLDADAVTLVLVSEDGKVHPLVKDAGSRMFFLDAKLRKRLVRLTGRLLPNSTYLQVVNVHSYVKGQLHDVYYWCDICTIRGFEPGICDCCGEKMEFRETPAK